MDGRVIKKIVVPSCVIIALSTTFVYEFKYLIDLLFFKKKHFLIIGILSAPENFQQRLSVRKTWLQLLSEISGSAYFVVGNEICEVPPYDRVDPYTCVDRPFDLPTNATPQTEFSTVRMDKARLKRRSPVTGFVGFGFYVRSGIVVKRLGILGGVLQVLQTEVQVKLVSAVSNTVLASVTFSSELLNKSDQAQVLSKAIRPVRLSAQQEAYVKLESRDIADVLLPRCDFALWQFQPHVIHFIHLWQENSAAPRPFREKACTFSFMTYTVVDTEQIKEETKKRSNRLKEWYKLNRKLSLQLEQESKFYRDILFVDVIDVYRNLSRKMVDFYKSILDTEYFHYVLKADDDSFVDLVRVHNQLRTVSREIDCEINETFGDVREAGVLARLRFSRFWWWSSFKEFWKVERWGKWREDEYRSASYPTFPCGGGYVLNKGVVDYVASSRHHLHHFQGEDVSLGIWLSALPVTQYQAPKVIEPPNSHYLQRKIIKRFKGKQNWTEYRKNKTIPEASNLCEWTCDLRQGRTPSIPLCNKVQLSVANMYATWEEYISKGYL